MSIFNKKWSEIILVTLLMIPTSVLRFENLGYSDYIGDEHKSFIELESGQSTWDFFMSRRKGPMQFLVSYIPYLLTHDYRNELAERIPYAMLSVLAVLVFYLLVKKLTKNKWIAFISAFLLSVNGFIVGFGRIAQYQNLNLLFSFLSLYFYADLLDPIKKNKHLKSTILGTLFFCLSTLSHWDSIFILPMILCIFFHYLKDKTGRFKEQKKLILVNFVAGCVFLLPFLIPYVSNQISREENVEYFERRVEVGYSNLDRYKLLVDLYNPFIAYWFMLITAGMGVISIKRSYPYLIWFLYGFGIFELFVRKPGTHIYNFVIPLLVMSSMGIFWVIKISPMLIKALAIMIAGVLLSFFYYQSYMIYVDHAVEYPWTQKRLINLEEIGISETKRIERKFYGPAYLKLHKLLRTETPEYNIDQKLPLFGFPHYRAWNQINDYVNEQNKNNNEEFGYMTNEVNTISQWYMDAKYQADDGYYVIGIKKPLSFSNDYKFPQIGGKETVYEIQNNGEEVVRIYKVDAY